MPKSSESSDVLQNMGRRQFMNLLTFGTGTKGHCIQLSNSSFCPPVLVPVAGVTAKTLGTMSIGVFGKSQCGERVFLGDSGAILPMGGKQVKRRGLRAERCLHPLRLCNVPGTAAKQVYVSLSWLSV